MLIFGSSYGCEAVPEDEDFVDCYYDGEEPFDYHYLFLA